MAVPLLLRTQDLDRPARGPHEKTYPETTTADTHPVAMFPPERSPRTGGKTPQTARMGPDWREVRMDGGRRLFLYEEIMLLALRDKEGTIAADDMAFPYALAASLLADLLFLKRGALEEVRKKKMVNLEHAASTHDPVLDECLGRLRDAKRRAHLATWVSRLSKLKKLKGRRERLERLAEGEVMSATVEEMVQAMRAALGAAAAGSVTSAVIT
jgi:hypothetical protein